MKHLLFSLLVAGMAFPAVNAQDAPRQYTFSWPIDGANLKPRGGTTKGPPVTVDTAPSAEWHALQAPGLTAPERDRRAILAMAGTYRVTFDFLEISSFPAAAPRAPYQSWGTEKVYVDRNDPKFISLVHILEMRVVQADGKVSDPMVVKHWRQDWTHEPTHLVEHRGRDQWQRRVVPQSESVGAWSQVVYQVDESPRYASIGRWQHTPSFSSWLSADTWRPLPRREWSVRDDYQALIGTNRHTVLPTGWLQEENNLKAVVSESRALSATSPYVGREYGVARYERIKDADFAAADRYYERTRQFWDEVRDRWSGAFAQKGTITLTGPVDKNGLFKPLFDRADTIEEQPRKLNREDQRVITEALEAMGVKSGG
jgi:hypothetical protein